MTESSPTPERSPLDAALAAGFRTTGGRVGAYRLEEEIGRGGQGVVYRATHVRTGRVVAVKVLRGLGAGGDRLLEYFRREARIAARLDHPGLCPVYDAEVDQGVPYIAMRFVEGDTLAKKLHATEIETATLPIDDAARAGHVEPSETPTGPKDRTELLRSVEIIEKAARALHAAHEAGVVHRDVKPGNIMIGKDGEPVVMDFGLARTDDAQLVTLTQEGDLFGTPAYMSPEQLTRQSIRLDRRSDVWSLGVSLYECITGVRPFRGPTNEFIYQQILGRDPVDPSRLNSAVPRDLAVVTLTALEKDLGRRYQTAEALAEDLRRVRVHEPVSARPIGPWTRLLRWSQRQPALAAALVAAFVLLGSGASVSTWFALRSKQNALEASRHLLEWEQLADGRRLEELLDRSRTDLWPAVPSRISDLEQWLVEAESLAARLPIHQAALSELRSRAEPYTDADADEDKASYEQEHARLQVIARALERLDRADASRKKDESDLAALETKEGLTPAEERTMRRLEKRLEDDDEDRDRRTERRGDLVGERARLLAATAVRRTWDFAEDTDQFRHDRLREVVDGLKRLARTETKANTIAGVRERLALARRVVTRFEGRDRAAWSFCTADLKRVAPPYGRVDLQSIPGLVPLGKDADSGLWEFWHVASGARPAWEGEALGEGKVQLHASDGEEGLVLVLVPGGSFRMGAQRPRAGSALGAPNVDIACSRNEGPVHEVTLAPFFISKYEVTQRQWLRLTGRKPSSFAAGRSFLGEGTITWRNPVTNVHWRTVREGARRWDLELPTEAQWEYACRAGTTTVFHTGDATSSLQGYENVADRNARRHFTRGSAISDELSDPWPGHAPVGSFLPNDFGLHDVHGNVIEWCLDGLWGYDEWEARPGDGLRGPVYAGLERVVRGGCYQQPAMTARSADRHRNNPSDGHANIGFRPVRRIERAP